MINLIPNSVKKTITREYWLRVVSVWFFMLAFALLLILSLQLPTYVLVASLERALESQITTAAEKQDAFSELENEIIKTNELIDHLGTLANDRIQFSELIYELDAVAPDAVTITQFVMERKESEVESVEIVGEALNRTALSDFRDGIEEHELFERAELPISNLAKDRDIVFSMTITMAESDT